MRKFVLVWIWFGLLAVIGLVAYGASSSIDFLRSGKFVINGISVRHPVINYNGNVYVPLRLVGEEMHAEVHYDEEKELITIKQQSLAFDEQVEAPVPSIAYENRYKDGSVWMQEIPLLQGSSCWNGCLEVNGFVGQWVTEAGYPPVSVKPDSNLVITYQAGLEPDRLTVFNVMNTGNETEQFVELMVVNRRLQLPTEPGVYTILVNSDWKAGFTSYAFVVHITDG
ncbi:MAG: copper amine oxidase N-terminal domain-containing protein [Paenibacillus lautus]|uniref:stalk domain-containing protein n=1 Tax=Paenibacillus lautus TaxID=1401 RepID=UPI0026F31F1C|nr:stalk domain-containing protein [Paenibacillus lautus]MCI1778001.1 copper amine oxidase N-terminal domain-containing protein [Paenibacillus lautus]